MLSRRDFLSAACVATVCTPSLSGSPLLAAPRFLQSRPLLAPQVGLLEASAGTDLPQQILQAARYGFTAFCDSQFLSRSLPEQSVLKNACHSTGMVLGPVRGTPLPTELSQVGDWSIRLQDDARRAQLFGISGVQVDVVPALTQSLLDSSHHRATMLRLLVKLGNELPEQCSLLISPWQDGRSLVAAGNQPAAPTAFDVWAQLLLDVGSPNVRYSLDTYHLGLAGVDIPAFATRYASIIGAIELADFPGGLEPGTGTLPLRNILQTMILRGYRGVISLRHGTSSPGVEGERAAVRAALALVGFIEGRGTVDSREQAV